MKGRTILKIALVSAAVVVAGLWAYNRFPQFQKLVGAGSATPPLKRAA